MTKNKKPVIIQVIPELGQGGAEQGCIDVAAALSAADAVSIVVSSGGTRVAEFCRSNVTHIDLPVKSKNPLVMSQNVKKLREIIEHYQADIVHARSRAPAWSALKACEDSKARFMTTCHAAYNIEGKIKRIYNSSIARGEKVIAISEFVADYLRNNYKIDDNRIRVIPRGVALEKFHPAFVSPERIVNLHKSWRIPDSAHVIMMPGRITRLKGHKVLIDAIALLGRDDVFCVFPGSDQGRKEYRQEVENHIIENGLEGMARFVDSCSDMPAAYMLSAVVVSASTEPEGFGRVPTEGQAMGRPVVATDHGGARETIMPGETGWLVPPSNPEALARAINEALSLAPLQRAMLATRSMSHVASNFTKANMADKTLDVYAELLGETL